jgi:hypothetical protein
MSPSDPACTRRVRRRTLLAAPLALASLPVVAGAEAEALLRAGGVVIGIRHSLAPGTFDPPGFRLDDCRTQRNLNDEGRAQARRLGQWFRERGLVPESVRTSPWCRCVDTAELAFGSARPWTALGSPVGSSESVQADKLAQLSRALAQVARRPGRFEAWVTHMFVLRDLAGVSVSVGVGLVLAPRDGRLSGLARRAGA